MSCPPSSSDKRKASVPRDSSNDAKRQDRSSLLSPSIVFDRSNIESAKELLNDLMRCPQLLHDPDLKFVKSFLLHFDCRAIPEESYGKTDQDVSSASNHADDEDEFEEDDFIEECIDYKLLAPETVPFPPDGASPETISTLTEQDVDRATDLKREAIDAVSRNDLQVGIDRLSCALQLMPTALLYARRAEVLLLAKRPNAALADCNTALALNPESAKGLKIRGHVYRAFGEWEYAKADLSKGMLLDPDEDATLALKECNEALQRVQQRREARLHREQIRMRRRQERRATQAQSEQSSSSGKQVLSQEAMGEMMNDPEMIVAMKNPRVLQAMQKVAHDPAAVLHYMHDPTISKVITSLASSMCPQASNDSMQTQCQSDDESQNL